jgi:phosphopantothenoylcysteine decarboxylase/phosphopantothenate--cysteine ligase
VLVSEFERDPMRGAFPGDGEASHDPIGHLELAANCDAFLVAPASANTLAKLAGGIADSMLTTSFLACSAPRLVAPAMNDRMYAAAATQANLATLRERGIEVIEPEEGRLASRGEHGRGRLPDPARLLGQIEAALPGPNRPWDGLRVLVTAGGTREPIDPVRYIGNRSSGRMGIALAAAAARRGAEVTLIAANVALAEPAGVRRIDVATVEQLAKAAAAEFPRTHVLLMAAAPADFRVATVAPGKLARREGLSLRLEPTEDILASLAAGKAEHQTVVGFAAEHGEGALAHGRDKLARKGLDAVVVNDIARADIGFEGSENEVTIVTAAGERHVPRAPKVEVARAILEAVAGLRSGERTTA